MDADGTNLTRVTDNPAGEFLPDWSPDGTRLVFARQSDTNHRHLVIIDLDSDRQTQLTDLSRGGDAPAWSPDGTKIAFSGYTFDNCLPDGTGCDTDIFLIDIDGTNLTQLTDSPGVDYLPDWSPDGTKIAFHTTRNDPIETSGDDPFRSRNFDVNVMNHDGTEVRSLTDYTGSDSFPSWSSDGKTIAFTSDRSGILRLYTMGSIDGSDVTLIAPGIENAFFPDWSPVAYP